MILFSILPTFIHSIFNTEFNYAEHLNKQYLTANYSAPWKPLANKLAMLMWESVLIFLAVCAYKGSSTALRSLVSLAIVDWWIKQIGLDLRIKKGNFRCQPAPSPSDETHLLSVITDCCVHYFHKHLHHKNDFFDYRQPYFSFSLRNAILVDISASRQNNEKLPWDILARLLPCVLIGQRPNIPSLKRD